MMSPRPRPSGEAAGFAKRVLIVDPDQKTWAVGVRLLIAQGFVVHRINNLADAPPRWPQHLYDLVVVATEDPARPEVVEFCQRLAQVQPPVRAALLVGGSPGHNPTGALLLSRDRPAPEVAEAIAQLLR